MEFANNESKVDVVLSDMYVAGKLLARVQAERKMDRIIQLQRASNKKSVEPETEESEMAVPSNRRNLLGSLDMKRRRSIMTLQAGEDGKEQIVVMKNILTNENEEDVSILKNAGHYSIYAQYIYFHVHMTLENILPIDATNFVRDINMMSPVDEYSLAMWDIPYAQIHYANFYNGIAATPYAIIVDDQEKSVVITIRGTNSLEDWVADLQYVPQPLDKVGELCGFDGKGRHCHKGVLTRCKWTYNDIKKNGVLKNLYSNESPYKEYNLVVCGHSLGGGCAQVLSLMLRPSFPSLRCYAFEPPGCIFDDSLSEDCKEWIISVVRHEDVVPRITQPNLESLRDEFFDVLARIKVPKSKAFHDVRAPCPESHLASRNAKVLCPKHQIERDTEFYRKVSAFRNERASKNLTGDVSVKLYIPGRIIYLIDTKGDGTKHVGYWASRYEFNQVILSGRMLSDHHMPSLVDVLRTLKLDDEHVEHTWHIEETNVGEDDTEVRLIIPFSFPQGKVPPILVLLGVAAIILAALSNHGCKYVERTSLVYPVEGEPFEGMGLNAGLWSYNLAECIDGQNCNITGVAKNEQLVDSGYCQPYTTNIWIPDVYWRTARAFGSLSVLLGSVGIGLISIATCTKLKKRTWIIICAMFLVATLAQGLQFLFLKSDLCSVFTIEDGVAISRSEGDRIVDSSCSISIDGKLAISAAVFWFLIAVGCSYMAKVTT